MRTTSPHPSTALVRSAYEHCTRIAIGMLTSQESLPPQLFIVGHPAHGDDAATSKIAHVGAQAMATFHSSQAGADQLSPFIRRALDPEKKEAKTLLKQIGRAEVAVHACHALIPADTLLPYPENAQPVTRPDGHLECLLITVHTLEHVTTAYCPIYRDAAGTLKSSIVPLDIPAARSEGRAE